MKKEAILIRDDTVLIDFLQQTLGNYFSPGSRIAVKLHMGEPGNVYFIKRDHVKPITDVLKNLRCKPYLFDTPVIYRSPRDNVTGYLEVAAGHGFTELYLDVPIVVSNRSITVKGTVMEYQLASDPIDADGVLLVSHVKGHLASGMGGAIKNIGMGCMSRETKGEIHTGGEPYYTDGCTQCMECVENCPTSNIRIDEDRPWFDCTWCPGCSNCVVICPEKCISPKTGTFDELIAEAAALAHNRYKKIYAVNVLKNITQLCDCVADSGPVILEDIGYLCGEDMLSVDIASLKTIEEKSGKADLFADYNKRSPWRHVRAAAGFMQRDMDVTIREAR